MKYVIYLIQAYAIVLLFPIIIACVKGCLGLNTGISFQVAQLILSSPLSLSSLQNAPYAHISLIEPLQLNALFSY